jgi:hypothetical protein
VRTETAVGSAPDAFVDAGADLAATTLDGLEDRTAVVVGAGHMAALAVKHLRARGVGTVRILNRSLERARVLAERTGADHGDLQELPDALRASDIAISATGAAGLVLPASTLARVMDTRERRCSCDLAVPRDVEPSAATSGVRLGHRTQDAFSAARPTSRGHQARERHRRGRGHRYAVRRQADKLAPLMHCAGAATPPWLRRWSIPFRAGGLTPDERRRRGARAGSWRSCSTTRSSASELSAPEPTRRTRRCSPSSTTSNAER